MRRALTAVAAVLAVVLVVLGAAGPASAHNVLVGSSPHDGAKLRHGPRAVVLTFNQPVQHGYDTITVTGPGGGRWEAGATTVDDRTVRVRVRPLGPAGAYTVGYRILSADGHPVSGELKFSLRTAGTGTPSSPGPTTAAQAANADGGGGLAWLWIAIVVVIAVGAVIALLRRARDTPS
ncbi:MAG TPA: copper resistance CopC family protein [Streptosporangiaceae bacterium]|jgi:hypothetical protein